MSAGPREMIRDLQPDLLVNDRLPGCGDFETPEQFLPAQPPARPWEVCMTMNESWGYNPSDTGYKTARRLIQTLCETAGRGGNLLLNVSPMGDGRLPEEQAERLSAISDWMSRNAEAIAGTQPRLEPWQFYGPSTRGSGTLYLFLLMRPYDSVTVRGLPIHRVTSARALSTGQPLKFTTRCSIADSVMNPDPPGAVTIDVPEAAIDPYATIIALEIAGR